MYRLFPAVLAALLIALFAPLSFAIEPTTLLQIHVTNTEGKPVGNASVIVRFVPDRINGRFTITKIEKVK